MEYFEDLYRAHQGFVYGYIRKRVDDPQLAEEFASETWLRAWRRRDTLTYGDPRPWLATIARNIVIDHGIASKRRPEMSYYPLYDVELTD
ncbi:MAG TPA: sigma factor, partial [Jatrophihabitantaceae bacterium]